jgi:hypothetical protein
VSAVTTIILEDDKNCDAVTLFAVPQTTTP